MKKSLLLSLIPAVLALGLSVMFWSQLPDRLPIHWNMMGVPDRFGSKTLGLLLFPGLMFLMPLIWLGILKLDPRKKNIEDSQGAVGMMVFGLMLFFLALHGLVIKASFSQKMMLDNSTLMILVGVLVAGLGLLMPRFKSNFFMGIRTPWTLDSDVVWEKTHRLAGKTMFAGGLLGVLLGFVLPANLSVAGSLVVVMLGLFVPVVASYVFFQQENALR